MDANELRAKMLEKYRILKTWRKVAKEYEISTGMAYRIAREGFDPKNTETRKKLGLTIYHLVPVRSKPCPPLTPEELKIKAVASIERAVKRARK